MRQRHRAVSLQLFLLVASTVLGAPLVAGQRLDGSLPVVTAQLELSVPSPANTAWTFPALGPLTVDDQGRLYVIDAGDQLIYVFTSRGELIRKLGRRGGGPGEFTNGRSLVVLRDSLWVIDTQNNRVTGIALGGNPGARTLTVSAPMVIPAERSA